MKTAVSTVDNHLQNSFLFLMLNSLGPENLKLVLGDLKDIIYIQYVAKYD